MRNNVFDKHFLKKLDEWSEREIYVKLISLDFQENPRLEIEGVATGGSIKIDGASSVRRVCSLNMVTKNARVNEVDWALESKFKLQIGLCNFVDKKYPNIIWFPQGTYIITSFSSTKNSQGYSISLQGKDKMCLLDGSVGGNIFAAHDFGKLEIRHADGSKELEDILIYDIIKNAIHEYAGEPYENIIINDLEDCAVELLSYRSKNKNVIIYNAYDTSDKTGIYTSNMAFEGNRVYTLLEELEVGDTVIDDKFKYELVKKVGYGDTIGYRLTDLTYVGDLILGAGSTITSMLDSLVKMLGEFEYYYDIEGRFVFQRKKIYYNVSWTNTITTEKETRYDSIENGSENAYEFTKGILIESYSNKPDVNNIKNDYTIWGKRKGSSGQELSIHLRCAIDEKPEYYYPLLNDNGERLWCTKGYIRDDDGNRINAAFNCDWRELIYQMAYDYLNSDSIIADLTKQISSFTGPEQELEKLKTLLRKWESTWDNRYVAYYTDLLEFWRQLYNPDEAKWFENAYWNPEFIICRRHFDYYESENGKYYFDEATQTWIENSALGTHNREIDTSKDQLIFKNHAAFNFWLDFLDDTYLEKYYPSNVGRRTKVVNDTEVKAIFFEETPNILFIDPASTTPYTDSSLSYVRLNLVGGMANYVSISTQGKSAKEVLDTLVYQHTYCCESITLNCIPIYYLEPNVRISVYDEDAGINGEYIIKSLNIPLAFNGSMSISATRAEDLIL